jgi:hypothetical protein
MVVSMYSACENCLPANMWRTMSIDSPSVISRSSSNGGLGDLADLGDFVDLIDLFLTLMMKDATIRLTTSKGGSLSRSLRYKK